MFHPKSTRAGILAFLLTAFLLVPELGQCFYNPSTGRWLSRDPISEHGGLNLYKFVSNAPLDRRDAFGLRGGPAALSCYCCECADDIWLSNITPYEDKGDGKSASYFQVNILLTYRTVRLTSAPESPIYNWEENSNRPTKDWARLGQKPNEWTNLFKLDPAIINHYWTGRDRTCDTHKPAKIVLDGDNPTASAAEGPRTIHFRLSVVNPPECKCPHSKVEVTATQNFDPAKNPPMEFKTP